MLASVLTFTPLNVNDGDVSITLSQSVVATMNAIRNKERLINAKHLKAREKQTPEEWESFHTKAGRKKRKRDPVKLQQMKDSRAAKFIPGDDTPAFIAPVSNPKAIVKKEGRYRDARMDALGEQLGFVPGSTATHAELKSRMVQIRSFYRGKRNDNAGTNRQKKKRTKQPKKKRVKIATPEKSDVPSVGAPSTPTQVEPDNDISFGSFTFKSGTAVPSYQTTQSTRKSKDVDLLRRAEKRKAEEEQLRQSEGGRQQLAQDEWDKMNKLAAGGQLIKDDIKILKKQIKKRQKKKEKSRKTWDERQETVKDNRRAKQDRYLEGQKKTVSRKREKRLRRTGFGTKKKHINK